MVYVNSPWGSQIDLTDSHDRYLLSKFHSRDPLSFARNERGHAHITDVYPFQSYDQSHSGTNPRAQTVSSNTPHIPNIGTTIATQPHCNLPQRNTTGGKTVPSQGKRFRIGTNFIQNSEVVFENVHTVLAKSTLTPPVKRSMYNPHKYKQDPTHSAPRVSQRPNQQTHRKRSDEQSPG